MNTNNIEKSSNNHQYIPQPETSLPKRERVNSVADIAGQIINQASEQEIEQPGSTKRYKAEELRSTDDVGEMELLVEKDEAVKGKRDRDEKGEEGLNQPEEKSLKIKLKLPKKPQVQAAISSKPSSIWETVTTNKLKIQDREKIAKELINQGANIDETNQDGITPLIWGASSGLISICTFLVKSKANVDAQDNKGKTALMYAAGRLCKSVIKLLSENGANANIRSQDGSTALMFAARNLSCYAEKIFNLLLGMANTDINAQNNEGLTALIFMVQGHSTQPTSKELLVDLMLKKGANVNLKDKSGRTALICAAQNRTYKNVNILKALINNGANVNAADDSGNTALHYATKISNMMTLINCGADIHKQNKSGLTALGKLVNFPPNIAPNDWFFNDGDEEMGKFLIDASLKRLSSGQKERLHIFSLCLSRTPLFKDLRKMIIPKAIRALTNESIKLTAKSLITVNPLDKQHPNELQKKLFNYLRGLLRPNTKKK